MGISGFFGKRNITKIDVEIGLPEEIYAKKTFPAGIKPVNAKKLLPGFLLRFLVEDREVLFPFHDTGSDAVKHLSLTFSKRGEHKLRDVHVCSVFPFNFFIRCRRLENNISFIVFPEPRKGDLPNYLNIERRSRGDRSTDRTGHDSEVLSVREYITSDPMKYINWKATAKTGDLKTKELSTLSYQPVIIDFDKIDIPNIEEKLSYVTYTVLQLYKRNIPFGLRTKSRLYQPDISRTHKLNILKELALYGQD